MKRSLLDELHDEYLRGNLRYKSDDPPAGGTADENVDHDEPQQDE